MTENTMRAFRLLEATGPKAPADLAVLIDADLAERRAQLLDVIDLELAGRRAEAATAGLATQPSLVARRAAMASRMSTADPFEQVWG